MAISLPLKETLSRQFHSCLEDQLNNPYERRRFGGSSGHFSYTSSALFKFLAEDNSAPRKRPGCIVMRLRNPLLFRIYYFRTHRRDVTFALYSVPVKGGSFQIKDNLFNTNTQFCSIFKTIVVSKAYCAAILLKLGDKLDLSITPLAVRNEIDATTFAQRAADKHFLWELREVTKNGNATKKRFLSKQYGLDVSACNELVDSWNNSFYVSLNKGYKSTLINHPVGLHQDSYNNKIASLESRITASFKSIHGKGFGRGGQA